MAATRSARRRLRRLSADEAFMALIIAAMEANNHTAPEEAARAQHIVQSMSRFRHRNGAAVGKLIATMKQIAEDYPPDDVIAAACRAVPPRLRSSALAIVADVILVDGRLQRGERQFLYAAADLLKQPRARAQVMIDVLRVKNKA